MPGEVLKGWNPRRCAALENVWEEFRKAGAHGQSLSDELIAERRRAAVAGDEQ
ncbi:hypothetical protein SAMN06264364_1591 [Quadrisphaera granulorum]|uniref:Uncharacterized protein n=1 Tax=Quadrisphaera granulorum TaxID=317664 RepID=A0A315ZHR2_9ACTN|nr:hypothetical protein [Quadrisphaera granulorum]PWJ45155.1 hypothetical protein BXY45_1591 [Quadrisphaera granulorum]SZE99190.1 hypothetical protein SAMN06264364_1591 [Quadrisphaera granulorum]